MPRLTPGCHLYEGQDGVWRYYLPGDRFVRITAPAATVRAVRDVLHGHRADDPDPQVQALIAALRDQGVLATDQVAAPRRGRVRIDGDGPIADRLATLMTGADLVGTDPDVVVSCAGWLPDRAWRELGAALTAQGVAWHGCYAEGSRWFAGPMAVPGRTAAYADTRARRLGACGVPDELRAYWTYLDGDGAPPPVPWPGPGVTALIAGLVAADVEAYLATGTPAAEGQQREIDPAGLTVTAHPVLPLPFPIEAA